MCAADVHQLLAEQGDAFCIEVLLSRDLHCVCIWPGVQGITKNVQFDDVHSSDNNLLKSSMMEALVSSKLNGCAIIKSVGPQVECKYRFKFEMTVLTVAFNLSQVTGLFSLVAGMSFVPKTTTVSYTHLTLPTNREV